MQQIRVFQTPEEVFSHKWVFVFEKLLQQRVCRSSRWGGAAMEAGVPIACESIS